MNELTSIALALPPSLGTARVAASVLGRVKRTADVGARAEKALNTAKVRPPAMAAGPRPVGAHSTGSLVHPSLVGTAFGEAQELVVRQGATLLNSVRRQASSSTVPTVAKGRAL
ncbi:hypothetical protein ABT246_07630 [Streptomyces sp. NPDC001553]|uniref:hypothetical protein n=1 Tax=Streptomyces sp. NPDC001553 TaxID=3154385 RepID=UPI0033333E24